MQRSAETTDPRESGATTCAYLIGDKDAKQLLAKYDFNGVYGRQAGKALADALEAAIAALWSSITTNAVGATSAVVSDLNVRQAINKLAALFYPLDECAFFFHPTSFWTQLVAIQKYYDQSQRGLGTGQGGSWTGSIGGMPEVSQTNKVRGSIYGIPVHVSANVVTALLTERNLLLHKSCLGFAVQTQGQYRARIQSDYLVQNIGQLTVADILYGVKVLREPGGVVISTSSTATTT